METQDGCEHEEKVNSYTVEFLEATIGASLALKCPSARNDRSCAADRGAIEKFPSSTLREGIHLSLHGVTIIF